jgi:hypothetical protein
MKRTESGLRKPSRRFEFPSELSIVMREIPLVHFSLMQVCKGLEMHGNATLSNWVNSRSTKNQKEKIHTLRVVFRKFEALRIPFAEYETVKNRLFTPDEIWDMQLCFFDRFEDGTRKNSFCSDSYDNFVYVAPESVFTIATWRSSLPFSFMKKCGVKEQDLVSFFFEQNIPSFIEISKKEITYILAAQGYSPELIANLSRKFKLDKTFPNSPVSNLYRCTFAYSIEISLDLVNNIEAYQRILPHFKKYYSKCLSKLPENLNLHAEYVSSIIEFKDFVFLYKDRNELIPPEILDKMVPQNLFEFVGQVPSSIEHALDLFIELFCYRQKFRDLGAKERVECFSRLFGANAPSNANRVIRKTQDISIIVSYTLWNFKLQKSRPRFMGSELMRCMDYVYEMCSYELFTKTLKEICDKPERILFWTKTCKHIMLCKTTYDSFIQ